MLIDLYFHSKNVEWKSEQKICRLKDTFIFPFWKIRIEIKTKTRGPWATARSPEWKSYNWYADVIYTTFFLILSFQVIKGSSFEWWSESFFVLLSLMWTWGDRDYPLGTPTASVNASYHKHEHEHLIINNNIYGLAVGIWTVPEILINLIWTEGVGHTPRGPQVSVIEYVLS